MSDFEHLNNDEAICTLCERMMDGDPGPHFVEESCLLENCQELCRRHGFTSEEANQVLENWVSKKGIVCCECLDEGIGNMSGDEAVVWHNNS